MDLEQAAPDPRRHVWARTMLCTDDDGLRGVTPLNKVMLNLASVGRALPGKECCGKESMPDHKPHCGSSVSIFKLITNGYIDTKEADRGGRVRQIRQFTSSVKIASKPHSSALARSAASLPRCNKPATSAP